MVMDPRATILMPEHSELKPNEINLSPLEDWILENGSEDDGFVYQTPMVAERIHGDLPQNLLRLIAVGALARLAADGLITVGVSIDNFDPVALGDLSAFFESAETWRSFGESSLGTAEYRATDEGQALNDELDRQGKIRTSRII